MQCMRISSNLTLLAAKWWQLLGPGCRRALFGHSCTALPARSRRRLQSEPAQQRAQTITAFLEIYHVTQWACGPAPGPGRRDASLPTKLTVQSVVAARSLGTQTTVETANCSDWPITGSHTRTPCKVAETRAGASRAAQVRTEAPRPRGAPIGPRREARGPAQRLGAPRPSAAGANP